MANAPHIIPLKLLDDVFEWTIRRSSSGLGPGRQISTDVSEMGMALSISDAANLHWALNQLDAEGW
ncbi:MAG: hypothetical protein ABL889_20615, partial [Terricaulis sp.]